MPETFSFKDAQTFSFEEAKTFGFKEAQEVTFMEKALDIPVQVGTGVMKAIENTSNIMFPESFRESVRETIPGFKKFEEATAIPYGQDPKSIAGAFVRGASQFLTGFIPANKAVSAIGISSKLLRLYGAGALADFTVFDAHEERLSNLIQSIPALQNPVTEYLAADKDDSQLEGRIKQVLEGAMFAGFIDGTMQGIRLVKGARRARQVAAAVPEATKETVQELPKVLQDDALKGLAESPLRTKKITVDATELAIEGVKEAAQQKFDGSKRIFKVVGELIESGEIQPEYIPEILRKYNLSPTEFAGELMETASFAGKILNRYSQIVRGAAKSLEKESPEAARLLNDLAKTERVSALELISRGWRRLENWRRGLLVTQLTTAVRNTTSQVGRLAVSGFDEALQTVILGVRKPSEFGKLIQADLNAVTAIGSTFKRGKNRVMGIFGKEVARSQLDEILDANASVIQKARLFSQPVHEVVGNRGVNYYLNVVNRTQEYFFRKLAFETKLRQTLGRSGLSLDNISPQDIPEDALRGAVDYALEMTFSAPPKDKFLKELIRAWQDIPGLTTINPFPRFAFANALPFVWQHSPLGFVDALRFTKYGNKLAGKIGMTALESGLPEEFAKAASRATVGTLLMWSAWNLRQSANAGERWYEFHIGEKTYDVRSYAPLSSFLFFSELIQDKINGTNKIKFADIAQAMIGLNRISGTGLALVDLLRAEKEETVDKIAADFAGQYMGSFGVPLRTVKDIVAAFSTEEAIIRNVKEDPLWAPFIDNIPVVRRQLPEATSPFREGIDLQNNVKPIRVDETTFKVLGMEGAPEVSGPIARQFFGITARIKNELEREVDRLDIRRGRFFPRTGDPKANRLIAGYAGYLNETFLVPIVSSDEWKSLSEPMRRVQLEEMVLKNKQRAIKMFRANHLDLALQLKVKNMDDDVKAIIGLTDEQLLEGLKR